jgi:hypothetical protein
MTAWDDKLLSSQCDSIYKGAGSALDWIARVRTNSQRLDREADGLNEMLRRSRNLCRRLGAAAQRPFSAGVFGMSQAGKSYLISTLARSANGCLETLLDGQRIDFIGHLNPPGGGKEATGLVTRFTRKPSAAPSGHPVELMLFSEADVVKILGNSFFNDFDRERITFDTDPDHLKSLLERITPYRTDEPTGGLTADDLVDIIDYFERRFEKSFAPLRADYWPQVIDLAPCLSPEHRAELLSVLWGQIPDLTQAYLTLRNSLQQISYAPTVFVPLTALVTGVGESLAWRPDSIINVDVLDRLGKDSAETIGVRPYQENKPLSEVPIARSILAALTAEIKFVLADNPIIDLLEEIDLLDFPGYRGRLEISDLNEVRKQLKRDDADPVGQLLLRAKVSYLFERYTEDQEMNVLLMCTRCDSQIEVTSLAPALSTWVHRTQGESPSLRGLRPPGLVWVITQLDRRLEPKPGQTVAQQQQEWANMIHITLLERFAQCDWLNAWSETKPFDNLFLVRKPGMLRSAFRVDAEGREIDFISNEECERLERQGTYFVTNDAVSRHVRDPVGAWNAVLGIDDGGMTRLAEFLQSVCLLTTKWQRIGEQVSRVRQEIGENRLLPYFQSEGADEVEKKRVNAEKLYRAIIESPDGFGELLYKLQLDGEQLRRLYLAIENENNDVTEEADKSISTRKSLINLPLKKETDSFPKKVVNGRAEHFAKAVISAWIRDIRGLPDNADLLNYLALDPKVVRIMSDELVTGIDRKKVEHNLVTALRPLENMRGTTRMGVVDQQVMVVRQILGDFIDFLGMATTPVGQRPESPMGECKILEPPPIIPIGQFPDLPDEELSFSGAYIMDWLEAFKALSIGNAGHSAGREISPEQNLRLGEILAMIGVRGIPLSLT